MTPIDFGVTRSKSYVIFLMQCTIFKLVLLSSTGDSVAEQVHAVYSYEDDFGGVFCAITGTLVHLLIQYFRKKHYHWLLIFLNQTQTVLSLYILVYALFYDTAVKSMFLQIIKSVKPNLCVGESCIVTTRPSSRLMIVTILKLTFTPL